MADVYKASVRIGDIRAGENPRRDFGDIDALAAAIEATGGQPVNPPVVVPDGPVWRLVDGERRVRALRKLHGDDGRADVLVCPGYDEAEEAVAMVATDAKQELTEQERARGFQRMLLLGVDDGTVAKALRRKVSEVRQATKVALIAPEQATLDQMICAAEFEDEDDRRAVLKAAPDKYASKAEGIRRRIAAADLAARFERKIAELGLDALEDQPEGYLSIRTCYTPDELEADVAAHEGDELAVWPCSWHAGYWVLGRRDLVREETPEERAERELRDRRRVAVRTLRDALLVEVATTDVMPRTQEAAGRLRAQGYNWDRDMLAKELEELGVKGDLVRRLCESPRSMYELASLVRSRAFEWWRWVCELLPAAIDDGFQPSDEDMWLLELARCEREEAERAEREGDEG